MSTIDSKSRTMKAPRVRLAATIGAHLVVDFFSFLIVPLLSVLEGRIGMSPSQGALLLAVGSVASGLIQPIVALLSDRFDTRRLGTIGFAAAVLAIGSVGWATSFGQLLVIQVVGAAGIGAFHPVAAAATGQLAGARRTLGLAWFYAAGMLGGMLGNLAAPAWVRFFGGDGPDGSAAGLRSLAWLMIPGAVSVALLALAVHTVPHVATDARRVHGELPAAERRARWTAVGLLYAGNVLRFIVDMALIQLIIRWTEAAALEAAHPGAAVGGLDAALRQQAAELNGPLQAAKQVGMGMAGLTLGFLIRSHHEKLMLVLVPLAGAAAIAVLPHTSPGPALHGGGLALFVCFLAGAGYAGVMPVTIGLAQRLLPHRTGLASALMMGGAWMLAAVGPPLAQWLYRSYGLERAMEVVAGLLACSALLALPLRLPAARG